MAREFAKAFYKSAKWLRCRKGYIAMRQSIDGGLCERCHDDMGYILHHKIALDQDNIDDPNITLSWHNLQWLCQDCHNAIHNPESVRGLVRYTFDADGNIRILS